MLCKRGSARGACGPALTKEGEMNPHLRNLDEQATGPEDLGRVVQVSARMRRTDAK
jgi:hypothetical protein